MVKYIATAMALKIVSSNSWTRRLYRELGNRVGNRRRASGTMPAYYPERVKRMLHLQRKHKIVKDGDSVIELGTGWLHWEALTLRLFYDIQAVLFDVWDNRQLGGLKNYLRQLGFMLDIGFELSPSELQRAKALIQQIMKVESFAELYGLLGFTYVVEPSGSLRHFPPDSFQLCVSGGVLEHVKRDALSALVAESRRILKPNGWAVHSIDTADHLEHYDRSVSPKLYLSFPEHLWTGLFENEVQYINRVQRGEWIELFKTNGFEIVEEDSRKVEIGTLRLADKYKNMDREDLECTVVRLTLK